MLKLKPFEQKPGYCGPASLKAVLSYFGVEKGEMSLVRLSKCSKDKGVEAENLLRAAKKLGFKGFIKDYSDFKDVKKFLKKKIPVIVDWFSVDEGHYSVIVGINDKKIFFMFFLQRGLAQTSSLFFFFALGSLRGKLFLS